MLLRRLGLSLGAVVTSVVFGTAGYWLIGEGNWPLIDCLYQTVIGLTTAGFGEIVPLGTTTWGRPFTILLLLGGMVSMGWFVTTVAAILIEGELTGFTWRRRMDSRVENLSGHTIVCGAGSTGIHCIRELAAIGAPFVVVDAREAVAREISATFDCAAVVGDATHDEVLLEAGIERARGVISALTDDKDNLFVTVTARALNPRLRIVAKAIELRADAKLRRAGADAVVSPNMIGGLRMASEMIRPHVVNFLDLMLKEKSKTLRVDEIAVTPDSPWAGKTIGDTEIHRKYDLLALAVRKPNGDNIYNPLGDLTLLAGDVLIVMGDVSKVRAARETAV